MIVTALLRAHFSEFRIRVIAIKVSAGSFIVWEVWLILESFIAARHIRLVSISVIS